MKENEAAHDNSSQQHNGGHTTPHEEIATEAVFSSPKSVPNEHITIHSTHHLPKHTKQFLTTPVAILLAGAMIACGLVGYGLVTSGKSGSATKTVFTGKAIDSADFVDGKAKSDVVVIEYSDSECPFCMQVHPTLKKLRADYGSKVAFVYRYFPLTQIHPHAFDEARAIACAGKIGGKDKFYAYIDAIFGYKIARQTTQLTATGKEDIANEVGLDKNQFVDCMTKQATAEVINSSINDGIAAGVQGTPASFVLVKTRKGYEVVAMIDGARPYEFFKAAIEEALSR